MSPSSECIGFIHPLSFLLSSVPLLSYVLCVSYLCIFSHKIIEFNFTSFLSQIEMIFNSTLFYLPSKTGISDAIQSPWVTHDHHQVSEDDGLHYLHVEFTFLCGRWSKVCLYLFICDCPPQPVVIRKCRQLSRLYCLIQSSQFTEGSRTGSTDPIL